MKTRARIDALGRVLVIAALLMPAAFAQSSPDTVPGAVGAATPAGSPDPTMQMGVSVWMRMHNKPKFSQALEDLYNPDSPSFHHWMTVADLSQYAPTDSDIHLLGNAAPAVAHMSRSAVLDVVPITSPTNPSGFIVDASGTTSYSAADLLAPALRTKTFYSALCSFGDGAALDLLSFGTDTSLTVTEGWDNVTGFGTPNGMEFIEAARRVDSRSE